MARVPYSPVPQASPSTQETPLVRVDTPIQAFGGAVAQAVEHLGAGISHAGNELYQRGMALQELRNRTEADEADAEYMKQAGLLHAKYNSLEGKAAVDALPSHLQELDAVRKDIRQNLSTDMSRRLYDGQSRRTLGRTTFSAAGHAASQNKRWAAGTLQAKDDLEINDLYNYPNDQNGYNSTVANIQGGSHEMAALHGWGEEQRQAYVKEKTSKALSMRILGMAKTEPLKAYELFEANKIGLFGQDHARVETGVFNQMRTMYSRNISNKVLADLHEDPDELRKTKSLADRLEEAQALAEKEAPNVPGLVDAVRDRVHSDYTKLKRVNVDDNRAALDTVGNAVLGLTTPGGKLPTTMEELQADPKTAAALDSLRPAQIKQIQRSLTQNAKGDVNETPERRDRFYELLGQATTKPADFLDVDVAKEDLPVKYRTELFKKQQSLIKGAQEDPRLTRAMQTMQPDLESIGYGLGKNRELYYKFKGQFQMALEDYINENKKAPDTKTVREIGARLLREQVTPGTIFGSFWPNRVRLFEMDVPQKDIDEVKANIERSNPGMTLTDDQIRREVIRQNYIKLYKGAPKKADEEKSFQPKVPQSK